MHSSDILTYTTMHDDLSRTQVAMLRCFFGKSNVLLLYRQVLTLIPVRRLLDDIFMYTGHMWMC